MNLNLKFITKITKDTNDNEIIFLKNKSIKNKYLQPLNKSLFSSKFFLEQNFLKKDYKNIGWDI